MMIKKYKGGAVKMKKVKNEKGIPKWYVPSCNTCWAILEGRNSVITVTIQKGTNDFQKLQFCDNDCYMSWISKTADLPKILRNMQRVAEVIRVRQGH